MKTLCDPKFCEDSEYATAFAHAHQNRDLHAQMCNFGRSVWFGVSSSPGPNPTNVRVLLNILTQNTVTEPMEALFYFERRRCRD